MKADAEAPRVLVWGLGRAFERSVPYLKALESSGQVKIVAATAARLPAHEDLLGAPLVASDEVASLDVDYAVVANRRETQEIIEQGSALTGLDRARFIDARLLEAPGFSLSACLRLKERGVSIVSDCSWGAVSRRALGLKAASPFEDVFIENDSYLHLIGDIRGYCQSAEPVFMRKRYNMYGEDVCDYRLEDVVVSMRGSDIDEQLRRWHEGCALMDYDRLFVEMHTIRRDVAQKFAAMRLTAPKVCFVPWQADAKGFLTVVPARRFFEGAVCDAVCWGMFEAGGSR